MSNLMRRCALVLVVSLLLVEAPTAHASHSDGLHWNGSGDRRVKVIDSVQRSWDGHLQRAAGDWSSSDRVELEVGRGSSKRKARKRCAVPKQAVRVCNAKYRASWAGLSVIFYSGNHITRVKVKLNSRVVRSNHDKRVVVCHELGHALGLDHRPQADDSSCLTPILGRGTQPDAHDYAELGRLYGHNHAGAQAADVAGGERRIVRRVQL